MRRRWAMIMLVSGALAGEAGALEPGQMLDMRGLVGRQVVFTPQGPVEASRVIWQAVLDRYPEITTGPERSGTYLVGIVIRHDGSVDESIMAFAPTVATLREASVPIVDLIPRDLPMGAIAPAAAGSVVTTRDGERMLRASVRIRHRLIPQDWDTSRNADRVEQVVRRQRPEYFEARGSTQLEVLTVFLDDSGRIMRERRETSRPVNGQPNPLMGAMRPEDFQSLGIETSRIGVTGTLLAMRHAAPVTDERYHPLGSDGLPVRAVGSFATGNAPVMVRYAWERRPGEAIGGESSAQREAPPGVQFRQLPPASGPVVMFERPPHPSQIPGEGAPWALMSTDGKVLRTGRVKLAEGEPLLRTHLERLMPGIRIRMSQTISFTGYPGTGPGEVATLTSFVLDFNSPLPPPDQDAR